MKTFRAVNGTYLRNQPRRVHTIEAEDLREATEILINKRYNSIGPVGLSHETSPSYGSQTTQHQNTYMYLDGELAEHWNVQIQV